MIRWGREDSAEEASLRGVMFKPHVDSTGCLLLDFQKFSQHLLHQDSGDSALFRSEVAFDNQPAFCSLLSTHSKHCCGGPLVSADESD